MQIRIEEVLGMPAFLKFFLILLLLASLISGSIFALYKLHHMGVIEVIIPKPFRIYCFKNYITRAEKLAQEKALEKQRRIDF